MKKAADKDSAKTEVIVSVPPEPSDVPKYEAAISAVKAAQAALFACGMVTFITFLVVGAYYGFYVEPLRQFWYIWPAPGAQADVTKLLVLWGVAGLAAVVSVSYRRRPAEPPL